jgi:hypothetical protein
MKMGFEPEVDEHIVSKVRSAIGNDVATAIDTGKRCLPYDLLWHEEPIGPLDVDRYRMLKQALPTCHLAGAGSLAGSRAYRELVSGTCSGHDPAGYQYCERVYRDAEGCGNGFRGFFSSGSRHVGRAIRHAATLHY